MSTRYMFSVDLGSRPLLMKGEAVAVESTPMVRMPHGTIVRADDWHESEAAAARAAAEKLEEMLRSAFAWIDELRGMGAKE